MPSVTSQKVQQLVLAMLLPALLSQKKKKRLVTTPKFHHADNVRCLQITRQESGPSLQCLSAIAGLSSLGGTSDAKTN